MRVLPIASKQTTLTPVYKKPASIQKPYDISFGRILSDSHPYLIDSIVGNYATISNEPHLRLNVLEARNGDIDINNSNITVQRIASKQDVNVHYNSTVETQFINARGNVTTESESVINANKDIIAKEDVWAKRNSTINAQNIKAKKDVAATGGGTVNAKANITADKNVTAIGGATVKGQNINAGQDVWAYRQGRVEAENIFAEQDIKVESNSTIQADNSITAHRDIRTSLNSSIKAHKIEAKHILNINGSTVDVHDLTAGKQMFLQSSNIRTQNITTPRLHLSGETLIEAGNTLSLNVNSLYSCGDSSNIRFVTLRSVANGSEPEVHRLIINSETADLLEDGSRKIRVILSGDKPLHVELSQKFVDAYDGVMNSAKAKLLEQFDFVHPRNFEKALTGEALDQAVTFIRRAV